MIMVRADLQKLVTHQGVTQEVRSGTVTAHRGYPAGGGEDIITFRANDPAGHQVEVTFSVEEFTAFVRALGVL